jgi:hypothetical protein
MRPPSERTINPRLALKLLAHCSMAKVVLGFVFQVQPERQSKYPPLERVDAIRPRFAVEPSVGLFFIWK